MKRSLVLLLLLLKAAHAITVTLVWDDNNPPGTVDGYRCTMVDANGNSITDDVNVMQAQFDTVTLGATYLFFVTAYNSTAESDPSDTFAWTADVVPPSIQDLQIESSGGAAAQMHGEAAQGSGHEAGALSVDSARAGDETIRPSLRLLVTR